MKVRYLMWGLQRFTLPWLLVNVLGEGGCHVSFTFAIQCDHLKCHVTCHASCNTNKYIIINIIDDHANKYKLIG